MRGSRGPPRSRATTLGAPPPGYACRPLPLSAIPDPHLYGRDRRGQLLRSQVPKLLRKHVHAAHEEGRRKQNPHARLRCLKRNAARLESGARRPKWSPPRTLIERATERFRLPPTRTCGGTRMWLRRSWETAPPGVARRSRAGNPKPQADAFLSNYPVIETDRAYWL